MVELGKKREPWEKAYENEDYVGDFDGWHSCDRYGVVREPIAGRRPGQS